MRRSHALLVLIALAGCSRAAPTTRTTPGPPPRPTSAAPLGSIADAAAPPVTAPIACSVSTEVDTLDDGEGEVSAQGMMDLGDVQVVADDDTTNVTWTRKSHYAHGDTWRTPHLARKSGGTWERVSLPVLSYACATYGTAAANTPSRPFVSWGVSNNAAFEVFTRLPTIDDRGRERSVFPTHSRPVAEVDTTKQTVDELVAARDVSLAVLSEDDCAPSCLCANGHRRMSVWLRSLNPTRKWSKRLSSSYGEDDRVGAPALAIGDAGGIAAFRANSRLFLAWLDAEGKPLNDGAPVEFDSGDVGAPAVAMAGNRAIIVWARRRSKDAPYELVHMRLDFRATLEAPTPIKTAGSAFAPALIADAKTVVLAWTEGDSRGTHGAIHLARTTSTFEGADTLVPSSVVSGDETNARDPELSGTPERAAIVWQSFPKERVAGIIKVARVTCARPPFRL